MSRPMKLTALASLLLSALAIACGGEGDLRLTSKNVPNNAAGEAGSGGSGQAGGSAGEGGSAGSAEGGAAGSAGSSEEPDGPILRGVEQRGRFGNVEARDNMMWDGDFEWSGLFVSQYSWATSSSGWSPSDMPDIALGGQCRSGLKCARLPRSRSLAGLAVSPSTPMTHVRAWAKPPAESRCDQIRVAVGACFEGSVTRQIVASAEEPDKDGWCLFEGDVQTLTVSPCVFVQNKTNDQETPALLDDVYLGPSSATAPQPEAPSALAIDSSELEALRARLRKRRELPPPSRPSLPGRAKVIRHIKR